MEPIGLTASLVTLAQTTGNAINFFRNLHRAPSEIQQIRRHVRHLRLAMDLRMDLYMVGPSALAASPCLNPDSLRLLESVLDDAREVLGRLEKSLTVFRDDTNKTACVRWVIQHRTDVAHLSEHMHQLEQTAMGLLMTTLTSLALTSHGQLNEIDLRQQEILDHLKGDDASYPAVQTSVQPRLMLDSTHLTQHNQIVIDGDHEHPRTRTESPARKICRTLRKRASSTLYMIFQSQRDQLRTIYKLSGIFRLPFILSAYAISMEAKVISSILHWPYLSHSISIRNIVPVNSDFMRACDAGDFQKARDIALAGRGSPTDVDEHGQPALHKAVWSGSYRLTEFLLENGASANEIEGALHQSALQAACKLGMLEIARLLMSKGACVEHVDPEGLTAVVSLWHIRTLSFSRVEFLKAMQAYSPLPLRPFGNDFINPVFPIAAYGNAMDMKTIIELGADVNSLDEAGNAVMEHCFYGCNIETFDFLSGRFPTDWIHRRDFRGRTALHRCFQSPNPAAEILAGRLIMQGADIYAVDDDGLTVGDVAKKVDFRHQGIQVWRTGTCRNYDSWLKTLRAIGQVGDAF